MGSLSIILNFLGTSKCQDKVVNRGWLKRMDAVPGFAEFGFHCLRAPACHIGPLGDNREDAGRMTDSVRFQSLQKYNLPQRPCSNR